MLSQIRKRTGSIIVKLLLLLLILSFGVWGVGDMVSGNYNDNAAVTVGDVEIGPYELQREIRMELNRLRQVFGDSFDVEQARRMGILDALINQRVTSTLMSLGANDLGVLVSDEQIRARIHSDPTFRGFTGSFDRNRFQSFLNRLGLNEQGYIARLRREMSSEQYMGSFDGGDLIPASTVTAVYRHRNEKRFADTVLITDDRATDIASSSPAELAKYHEDHKQRFTAPEYRRITAVRLEVADLAKEISVSESELEEAFEVRSEEFNTPETRRVKQMILPDEATAVRARELLDQGRDFAEVAKSEANQDEASLDLGVITESGLPLQELKGPVFQLTEGAVTSPIQSALGWHLLKAEEVTPGGQKTFAEVRDVLKQGVADEKALDVMFELSNRLEDELGGGATLEEAAKSLSLPVTNVAAIDRAGRDASGGAVSGIPTAAAFLDSAFTTAEGDDSPLTEAGSDGFFVLRVDGVTAPALRPLETVRGEVTEAWTAEQRGQQAAKTAEAMVERLKGGATLSDLAGEFNLSVEGAGPFTRAKPAGFNAALATELFDGVVGTAAMARVENGYQVAVLTRVEGSEPADDKTGFDDVAGRLTSAMQDDLLLQLAEALRTQHGVSVNRRLVDEMFAGTSTQ